MPHIIHPAPGTLDVTGSDDIRTASGASAVSDACGPSNTDCTTGSGAGRYNVPLGNTGSNIRALCPAGHSCTSNARSACGAGRFATFVGSSACDECPVGSYADVTGNSHCTPCPGYSQAHFTGSTGCLACFFGEPRLVAGTLIGNNNGATPLFPNLPAEQPSPGEPARVLRHLTPCLS